MIISEDQLKKITGFTRRNALEKALRSQKIRFHYGQGGKIWTTLDAINYALGIISINQPVTEEIDF